MPSNTLTAGTVMNQSAVLMNDAAKSVYTFAVQLPWLKQALQELREWFELHSIAVTQATSAVIPMDAGETEIIFSGGPGVPSLPDDFVEPIRLWERPRNIDPWIPLTRRDFLPHWLEGQPLPAQFIIFQWDEQKITVLECSQDNDIKIDYIKELFQTIVDENSSIGVINAASYLEFKTAALMKKFIERDVTAAQMLESEAEMARDRVTGISSKSKQAIQTRRRPFRAGFKRRVIIS